MSDFTITNGVATITNPQLFSTWQERPDYLEALVASPDAEIRTKKRLFMDFEVALARMASGGNVQEDLDGILDRYVGETYIHHNPNIADGRNGLRQLAHDGLGGSPPPPVSLIVEGDLISALVQALVPDPTSPGTFCDSFFVSLFRVRDGQVVEHWASVPAMEPEGGNVPDG